MDILRNIGIGIGVFLVWIFANGVWEISGAPEHFDYCESIEWAQYQNKNEFRPDEWIALWIMKGVSCG